MKRTCPTCRGLFTHGCRDCRGTGVLFGKTKGLNSGGRPHKKVKRMKATKEIKERRKADKKDKAIERLYGKERYRSIYGRNK